MKTPFRSERIFHDSRGWFLTLRPDDAPYVAALPAPGQRRIDGHGVVVGPFIERDALDSWLGQFLDRYGRDRSREALRSAA
ncbi:MAG: hypothetical protein R3298_07015 [Gammaproteobacteria bacterium]|nr:hypothetical protein [Gammaproteobacteria bacterium]